MKTIKNKRIFFALKGVLFYWLLHILLVSLIGEQFKFIIVDVVLLFPTNIFASYSMDSILIFLGFPADGSKGLTNFYYGEILRKFLYKLFWL